MVKDVNFIKKIIVSKTSPYIIIKVSNNILFIPRIVISHLNYFSELYVSIRRCGEGLWC